MLQFGNPLVAGTVLVRPAIQSPDYVPGSVGWAIFQDGHVEFNSGVFRGTISAGTFAGTDFTISTAGAFFYSAAPALGNLIASIASAPGADSFGNVYKSGICVYDPGATDFVQMLAGSGGIPATVRIGTGDAVEGSPGIIASETLGSGATRELGLQLNAPRVAGQAAAIGSAIFVTSPSADLTTFPNGQVELTSSNATSTGTLQVTPAQISLSATLVSIGPTQTLFNGFINAPFGTAAAPHTITTDTSGGHTAANANSWTGTLKYRLNADQTVTVNGILTPPAGVANPSNVNAALAAAYQPASTQYLGAVADSNASHLGQALIAQMQTSGIIQVFDSTAGQAVRIFGRYPLDF